MPARLVAGATALSVGLGLAATLVLLSAAGFDIAVLARPGPLVEGGSDVARLLRWGGLLDMLSYLPFAVPVLYFHHRLRPRGGEIVTLLTAGGMAYVLIGAIGGALLASVWPPLVEGYATATAAGREAARVAFEAVANASLVGLLGTLELIGFAGWVIGVGWLLRGIWPRFAALSVLVGAGMLASSARTALTGRTLIDIGDPLALVVASLAGLFFVWALWLIGRLLRGDPLGSTG